MRKSNHFDSRRLRLGSFVLLACCLTLASATPVAAQQAPLAVRTALPIVLVPAADNNRGPRLPNVLVLHYTGCSLADAFEHYTQGHVSAHYTIDRTGDIYQHVDELEVAHHAGISYWRRSSINQSSIGIEIVNAGPLSLLNPATSDISHDSRSSASSWQPYPEEQTQSVIAMAQDILQRYAIDPFDVVGHADIAPSRKADPGPAFPWLRLAEAGIGVAYAPNLGVLVHGDEQFALRQVADPSMAALQEQLAACGYAVPQHGLKDAVTSRVIMAFNSHYLARFDDVVTDEMLAVLDGLVRWRRERQTAQITDEDSLRRLEEADLAFAY